MSDSGSTLDTQVSQPGWPIFICYRQVDGKEAAQWLHGALNGLPLSFVPQGRHEPPKLQVYFDQTAPAVDDWTRVHEPALERARAMLFVCSPGAHAQFDSNDWVHKELAWWLANRKVAPIIIDPTGEGARWIPAKVKERWPNAQQVLVQPARWIQLAEGERTRIEANVRDRIVAGISESEHRTTYEDLEKERDRTQLLRKQRKYLSISLAIAALVTVVAVVLAFYASRQALISDSRALAAMAIQNLAANPLQSLRMSLLAFKRKRTPEAEKALSLALSTPRVYLAMVFDAQTKSLPYARNVESLTFSSNGKQLLGASADGTARVWDTKTGRELLRMDHGLPVYFAAYSPDGRQIVTAGNGGIVRLWDAISGRQVLQLKQYEGNVTHTEYSPTGERLATADPKSGVPRLWDSRTGAMVAALGPDQSGEEVRFSPNGDLLATYGADIRLWDGHSGRLVANLRVPEDLNSKVNKTGVTSVRFSADGHYLIAAHRNGVVRIWDVLTRTEARKYSAHRESVVEARFSTDGKRIVTASFDGAVTIWDRESGSPYLFLKNQAVLMTDVIFSPDEDRIATFGFSDVVRVWDSETGEQLDTLLGHYGNVSEATFSPGGALLATGSQDGVIQVWDIGASRGAPLLLREVKGPALSAAFSKDDKEISTVHDFGGAVLLWDRVSDNRPLEFRLGTNAPLYAAWLSASRNRIVTLSAGPDQHHVDVWAVGEAGGTPAPRLVRKLALTMMPPSLKFLPHTGSLAVALDGKRVAAVDPKSVATVWETTGEGDLRVALEVPTEASTVALSPDGRTLVIAGLTDTAEIWDVDSKQKLGTLTGHSSALVHASFSPDGKRIVTAGWDRTARIWDLASRTTTVVLRGHTDKLTHAEFSPDGKRVVTSSADSTVRVWDAETGLELHLLDGKRPVETASFSNDGRRIVTAGPSVRVYAVDPDDLVKIAEEHLPLEDPRIPTDDHRPMSIH